MDESLSQNQISNPNPVPPPAPVSPASNMPPKELLNGNIASDQIPVAPPVEPPMAPPTPPVVPTVESVSNTGNPNKKRNIIFGIILFVLLISIVGLAGFALTRRPSTGTKEIVWWEMWEDESIVKPLIDEYEQSHPGIKIKYVHQDKEDYRQRLSNALTTGNNAPDIFRFHNTWVPMFKNDLDNMPSSVMSPAQFVQLYFPVIQSDLGVGGAIKGLPLNFDTLALFVNEDIFETYGKSAPTNWDDLRALSKTLTIKDPSDGHIKQAGVALGRTENVDHWQEILALMMMQNGVRMSAPNSNLAEQALLFFVQFATRDGVWDDTQPPSTLAFANGKLAMYFGPSWRVFEIKQKNPSLRFKVYPVPQLQKEKPEDPDITYASYWVEGVSQKSQVKPESWEFLKFISSKESLEKLYANESKIRAFGEIYPRTDMANLLSSDPIAGVFVRQAPFAKSWYLASRTWDGTTGINTKISKYYQDAIGSIIAGGSGEAVTKTITSGTSQVLSEYGISAQ